MSTQIAKACEVKRDWFVVDMDGKVLGRVASEIANNLRSSTPVYPLAPTTATFMRTLHLQNDFAH